VLGEVQRIAGAQHAADLGESTGGVRDGAERPRGQGVVDAAVRQGQCLTVQGYELDRHRAGTRAAVAGSTVSAREMPAG
jgi:hypothetical protein